MTSIGRVVRDWVLSAIALSAAGCSAASPATAPAAQADAVEPVVRDQAVPEATSPAVVPSSGEAVREPECDEPADCPGGVACVTGSLGNPLGCTGEECCGVNECGNGCRTAADCPACRPECTRVEGQETGSCRNPNGP